MGDPHADGLLLGGRGEANQALDISLARVGNEFHLYLFLLAGLAGMAGPWSRCLYGKLQIPGRERGHPAKPAGAGRDVVPLLLAIQAQDLLPDIEFLESGDFLSRCGALRLSATAAQLDPAAEIPRGGDPSNGAMPARSI